MLVVELAGLFIAEDLVGLGDGLEFLVGFFALLVGDFVGVRGKCGLEGSSCQWQVLLNRKVRGMRTDIYFVIGFLDFSLGGGAIDIQDLYAC